MNLRQNILAFAKSMRLFWLVEKATHSHLRVLCYHGATQSDESEFKPRLFISDQTFRHRIEFISKSGCNVLSLSDGIKRLKNGTLPDKAIVITIDDGWHGSFKHMAPVLAEYGYPATLYLSTYYVQNQFPVFNVTVQYLMWRSDVQALDLAEIDGELRGQYYLLDEDDKNVALRKIQAFADALKGADRRQSLLERIGAVLGVDSDRVVSSRSLSFMNADEVRALRGFGVDVQLHTHRHRFPSCSYETSAKEIADNRDYLRALSIDDRNHFCYPSGEYVPHQFAWLESFGVISATTTESGINGPRQSQYELRRILDSNAMSELEFEAEISGFSHLVRRILRWVPRRK